MYNCSTQYVPFYGAISVEWVLGSLWSWQDGADKNGADNCGEEHYDKDDEVSLNNFLNKNVYIDFFLSFVCIINISPFIKLFYFLTKYEHFDFIMMENYFSEIVEIEFII